jgi:hypothetical protein
VGWGWEIEGFEGLEGWKAGGGSMSRRYFFPNRISRAVAAMLKKKNNY